LGFKPPKRKKPTAGVGGTCSWQRRNGGVGYSIFSEILFGRGHRERPRRGDLASSRKPQLKPRDDRIDHYSVGRKNLGELRIRFWDHISREGDHQEKECDKSKIPLEQS